MFRALDARWALVATFRALRSADYSVLLQTGGPMVLPQLYRSFHVIGVPLSPDYPVLREGNATGWAGRLTLGDVTLHAAGPGERVTWPSGVSCLYINLRPGFVERHAAVAPGTATIETDNAGRDEVVRDVAMALLSHIAEGKSHDTTSRGLFASLTDHLVRHRLTTRAPSPRLGRRSLDEVLDELRIGEAGIGTMTEVARRCGLTRAHFTRRFHRLTGISPHALMLRSRVERAKALLASRASSVSEVAYDAGFTDQSHLSHAFQRFVGMTPVKFRQLHERTTHQLRRSTILQDRR